MFDSESVNFWYLLQNFFLILLNKKFPVVHRIRLRDCNRNHKLEISTAPTKAESWEPAYSQVLIQYKVDRQRVKSRESGRQMAMVDVVWNWDWEVGREKSMNQDRICWRAVFSEIARGEVLLGSQDGSDICRNLAGDCLRPCLLAFFGRVLMLSYVCWAQWIMLSEFYNNFSYDWSIIFLLQLKFEFFGLLKNS